MKIYLAKDWTGSHVFKNIPKLMQCGGMPPVCAALDFSQYPEE